MTRPIPGLISYPYIFFVLLLLFLHFLFPAPPLLFSFIFLAPFLLPTLPELARWCTHNCGTLFSQWHWNVIEWWGKGGVCGDVQRVPPANEEVLSPLPRHSPKTQLHHPYLHLRDTSLNEKKVAALFFVCFFFYLVEKKTYRSSWDLNLDHLSFIQTLFPLSHWRSGWHRSRV